MKSHTTPYFTQINGKKEDIMDIMYIAYEASKMLYITQNINQKKKIEREKREERRSKVVCWNI